MLDFMMATTPLVLGAFGLGVVAASREYSRQRPAFVGGVVVWMLLAYVYAAVVLIPGMPGQPLRGLLSMAFVPVSVWIAVKVRGMKKRQAARSTAQK